MTTAKTRPAAQPTILRIAVYLRFSQDRTGEELGFARHEPACLALAERIAGQRGIETVVTVYKETVSASTYSRKARAEYRRMIADIEAGRVDMVVAYHHDRLIRDPGKDLEPFIDLINAHGTEVEFCAAGRWDLSTANGKMQARIGGTFAAYESDIKSERIKLKRTQQAAAGEFRGGPRPFGFEPDGVTIRQSEALELVRMSEQIVAGVALRSLVRDLNDRGITASKGAQWSSPSLRRVLMRPRNAGLSEHHGEIVGPALWEPIVPEDVWHAVVALLSDPERRTSRGTAPKWLLSGLARCGVCGATHIRAAKMNGGPFYRCVNPDRRPGERHVGRDALRVNELVTEVIIARLSQPDAIAQLSASQGDGGEDIAALRIEQAALRQRLDSLADAFAAGDITISQMTKASETLRAKMSGIDARLAAAGMRSPLSDLEGPDMRTAWERLSLGQQRAIVDLLVEVTIMPAATGRKPGGHYFDPESVRIEWKA